MINSEERLKILAMVEERKISAAEASRLLESLAQDRQPEPPVPSIPAVSAIPSVPAAPSAPAEPVKHVSGQHWFRVRVTDSASGKPKVTVNLPLSLMSWGMKVGARFAPEVEGIDFGELEQLLKAGVEGKLIDVLDEEDGEHVEIFID
jgi:hypothetical protein